MCSIIIIESPKIPYNKKKYLVFQKDNHFIKDKLQIMSI
jgi:hypothetical protein